MIDYRSTTSYLRIIQCISFGFWMCHKTQKSLIGSTVSTLRENTREKQLDFDSISDFGILSSSIKIFTDPCCLSRSLHYQRGKSALN